MSRGKNYNSRELEIMNDILPLCKDSVCDTETSKFISMELKEAGFERPAKSVYDVYNDIRKGTRFYDGVLLVRPSDGNNYEEENKDELAIRIRKAYNEYFREKENGVYWNNIKNKNDIGKYAGIPKPDDSRVSISESECKMIAHFVRFRRCVSLNDDNLKNYAKYALKNLSIALGADIPESNEAVQKEKTLADFDIREIVKYIASYPGIKINGGIELVKTEKLI